MDEDETKNEPKRPRLLLPANERPAPASPNYEPSLDKAADGVEPSGAAEVDVLDLPVSDSELQPAAPPSRAETEPSGEPEPALPYTVDDVTAARFALPSASESFEEQRRRY